jgi:glycosyltransferase involved in cell wall biosynthesis
MPDIDYSIIIPHYENVGDLRRLLDSIPRCERIEVIVIDDYSSISCCRQIAILQKSYGFSFFHNSGKKSAGACRNIGLAVAKGKWILFADSDDFFLGDMIAAIDEFKASAADIVFFPPTSAFSDTGAIADRHVPYCCRIDAYVREPSRKNEDDLRYAVTPCSKMMRRDWLLSSGIRFDEIIASNDAFFSVCSGFKARKIEISARTVYCMTVRKGSLVQTISREILLARIQAVLKINEFYRSIGEPDRQCSVMIYLFESRKLGLRVTFTFLLHVVKSRHNPFIGWKRWFSTFVSVLQKSRRTDRYRIYK